MVIYIYIYIYIWLYSYIQDAVACISGDNVGSARYSYPFSFVSRLFCRCVHMQ